MQDQSNASLIDPVGECTSALLNLVITGKANPYLHNGIMITNVDDDFDVVGFQANVVAAVDQIVTDLGFKRLEFLFDAIVILEAGNLVGQVALAAHVHGFTFALDAIDLALGILEAEQHLVDAVAVNVLARGQLGCGCFVPDHDTALARLGVVQLAL